MIAQELTSWDGDSMYQFKAIQNDPIEQITSNFWYFGSPYLMVKIMRSH